MADNPTWEGLGQGMLVLAAVWWAWGGFAWLTNSLHSDDGDRQGRAAGGDGERCWSRRSRCPAAFGEDSVVFGIAYFAVRVIHIAVYTYGAPELNNREAIRQLAPGLLAAPALIVLAGFLDGGAAAGLWVVALVIDYGTPYLRDVSGFTVSPAHFHERFGLIVIIALGESIVATGSGLDATGLTAGVVDDRGRRAGDRRAPSGGPTSTSSRWSPGAASRVDRVGRPGAAREGLLRGPAPAADRGRRARRARAEEGAAAHRRAARDRSGRRPLRRRRPLSDRPCRHPPAQHRHAQPPAAVRRGDPARPDPVRDLGRRRWSP